MPNYNVGLNKYSMSDKLSEDLDLIKENSELRSRVRRNKMNMLLMLALVIFSTVTKCTDIRKSYNKGWKDCMDLVMEELKKVK